MSTEWPFDPEDDPLAAYAERIPLSQLAQAGGPIPRDYLEGLNEPQREAVETLDGPVLVLAGAGSGKTRVLTARLAHLIATGRARPSEILAVTFTNKAAREMRERVGRIIGEAVEGMPWLGTFHSIAAKMLRRHAELVGLTSSFAILDADDQVRLLKQVILAEGIDEKKFPAKNLAALIDGWKNRGLTPEKLPKGEGDDFAQGKGAKLYALYQDRLRTLNAADFGDLLLHMLTILQSHPDVLERFRERLRYLLVDEYQDSNIAQYLWLRLLAGGHKNICVVGDDDQSIYGWRGAEVGNILKFEKDFPGATVIRLEENYRSTPEILAAAGAVISGNQARLGKTLWTQNPSGSKVRLMGLYDGDEEARWVGEEIEAYMAGLGRRAKIGLNQTAILVRASHQMRAFEERFLAIGLPYRVIGGPRFYERQEIRDAIAYLRLVAQPDDGLAFERIVNLPRRGVGEQTLQAIHQQSRFDNVSPSRAALKMAQSGEIGGKARGTLILFFEAMSRWRAEAEKLTPSELAALVLDESGYTAMWKADKGADAPGRLDNLKELVRSIGDFPTLQGFLEHVSLVMEASRDGEGAGERLTLMTLHAAKGLEYDLVFLPGWEEGLFPSQRSLDESGRQGLEEERRLAYVGMTRARKILNISFAANRRIYNQWQSALPSRFIDETPPAVMEILTPPGLYGGSYGAARRGGYGGGYGVTDVEPKTWRPGGPSPLQEQVRQASNPYDSPGWKRMQAQARQAAPLPAAPRKSAPKPNFAPGERVSHPKFGAGVVIAVEADTLTVAFDEADEKRLKASFVTKSDETPF
ncbi:ATP-dependent helicase [Neomegalonema perideroedes]|uniref:ATP-dependent helicase n=1 Tax=Neomegalonema perideroedes TaxID=217219 RepID=UPI0005939E31|nr:UvrD-helicase domain-containing protein [Neomegalonema perideroedes]